MVALQWKHNINVLCGNKVNVERSKINFFIYFIFKWHICLQRHSTISILASQYLWFSDVEEKVVHLNKWC